MATLPANLQALSTQLEEGVAAGHRYKYNAPPDVEGAGLPAPVAAALGKSAWCPFRSLQATFVELVSECQEEEVPPEFLTTQLQALCGDGLPDVGKWVAVRVLAAIHLVKNSAEAGADSTAIPLNKSVSHAQAEDAHRQTPHATAGEGEVPAPAAMKGWQLSEQASGLMGQVVVLSAAPPGTHAVKRYAGKLMAAGSSCILLRSSCYNHAEGCEAHQGPDELWEVPAAGWTYSRLVSLAVHQTEAARAAMGQMEGQARKAVEERDAKVSQLEQELVALRREMRATAALKDEELAAARREGAPAPAASSSQPLDAMRVDTGKAAEAPSPPSFKHPATAADVKAWRKDILTDHQLLLMQLEGRLLSGLQHLPGGKTLDDMFGMLRLWVLACSWMPEWIDTPQHELGNVLFRHVLIQHEFVRNKVPRRDLERKLAAADCEVHEVTRVAATVRPPPARQPSGRGGKGGFSGNGRAGKGHK